MERRLRGWGPFRLLLFLSSFSYFFRARAITLVCEGPLAIGMKVGSCVEMESPGPRLYTHLPTRTGGQDRARGPSSPTVPPGGAPLLLLSSPPFLDFYLSTLSPSLFPHQLLSLSLPPTPFLAFLPPVSLPRSPSLSLAHLLLPVLGLLVDSFTPFRSGPRRLRPHAGPEEIFEFRNGLVKWCSPVLLTHWDHASSELNPLTACDVHVQLRSMVS